jgi:hypothetical protein
MKQIQLTRGFVALVDDEDYDRVSAYSWSCMNHGAAQARIGKTRVLMHRFILGLNGNRSQVVDHINHNPLDNRRCNLRICTPSQNCANRVPHKNNPVGYKGVVDTKPGWVPPLTHRRATVPMERFRAMISYQGEHIYIGGFPTAEQAAKAYDAKAKELFGEYALLNFAQNVSS